MASPTHAELRDLLEKWLYQVKIDRATETDVAGANAWECRYCGMRTPVSSPSMTAPTVWVIGHEHNCVITLTIEALKKLDQPKGNKPS